MGKDRECEREKKGGDPNVHGFILEPASGWVIIEKSAGKCNDKAALGNALAVIAAMEAVPHLTPEDVSEPQDAIAACWPSFP
jgi:hypothetical protein